MGCAPIRLDGKNGHDSNIIISNNYKNEIIVPNVIMFKQNPNMSEKQNSIKRQNSLGIRVYNLLIQIKGES